MNTYLLFKSLHLIAVVSWMAGLLYYASRNDICLGVWISFDLFKWNRNFFTAVVSNKDRFDSFTISL